MKKKGIKCLVGALIVALLLGVDQWTKYLAQKYLIDGPYVLWDGVFEFHYSRNRGAAFGILQNQRWFFILITCVILLLVVYAFVRIPATKRYVPMNAACILIFAGAMGNFLDRVRLEYVIDFLYFKLIDYPIFNVADCYITIACFGFALLVFFFYRDEDFDFLKKKKAGEKETRER
jgi:signal peptidase II